MSDERLHKQIESLRQRYRTEIEGLEEDPQQSFLDDLNDLVREIFKDKSTDIYTTLNSEALEKWKKNKWRRFWKNISLRKIFYILLLGSILAFLVSEAVVFYAAGGVITAYAYTKAILTELSFMFLNGFRSVGKIQMAAVGALRTGVFCLMLFVITSDVMFQGAQQTSEIDSISEQVVLLEEQIGEAKKSIEFYQKKNWKLNAARVEREMQEMRKELLELKKEQAKGKTKKTSDLVEYKTYGKAAFRVLLLFISILITRRLFKF